MYSFIAFATTATLEGAYTLKNGGTLQKFSDQYLVNCDTYDDGCDGGWPANSNNFI